jgi:hypothetical protein
MQRSKRTVDWQRHGVKALLALACALLIGMSATCGDLSAPPGSHRNDVLGMDCVGETHVRRLHGEEFANVKRFGRENPSLRTTARLGDVAPGDLAKFCDWEACVRTNGYAHTCWVTDAGWERCRVCDSGAECNGEPMNREDCVARVKQDPGRSQCHLGLLQECLIQRGLRGLADRRVTRTCRLSQQACAGELPGDLTAQALAAQHETDQVTVEVCLKELDKAETLTPDAEAIAQWRNDFAAWDGGLPEDAIDAASPSDAGEGD